MALTQRQLDLKSAAIQDSYQKLEEELMELVIDRLKMKTQVELTKDTTFQWYLEKLDQLGMLNWDTINELVEQTQSTTKKELSNLITKEGYEVNTKENKKMANLMKTPVKEWTNLDLVLNQYFDSQWLEFDNHINQTLLTTNYQNNSVAKMYQQALNDTVARTISGLSTPQKSFKRAIYEMVQNGIDVSLKDKGGKTWSLDSYVRTVIKSTTRTVFNDLRLERGINEYGIVTALMSHHAAARDACSHIQGKYVLMVPKAQAPAEYRHLQSVWDYGWKTPSGCNGINCNHRFYSQLPMDDTGMSDPVSPEVAQENAKLVAKQRRLERSIRQSKKALKAAELLEDQGDIDYFKNQIRQRQAVLRQFVDDNDKLLHRDYSRESVINVRPVKSKSDSKQQLTLAETVLGKTDMRSSVGDDNYKAFSKSIETIDNPKVKQFIEIVGDDFRFNSITNDRAFVKGDNIQLTHDTFKGTKMKRPLEGVYHELGHAIDKISSKRTDIGLGYISTDIDYKLKSSINKDLLNLANDVLKEANGSNYTKIKNLKKLSIFDQSAIVRKYKKLAEENPMKYGPLSDMMESTGAFIEYPLGSGHGKAYWKKYGKQEKEFFAHMTSSVANPDTKDMLYELFPNAAKAWESMLDDMIERMT